MFLNKVEICGVNTSELPLLSEEEKNSLFERIEQGDTDARDQYIKGNLRLVLSVIQRFSGNHENADDLFQVGCIGLMKAIDNFDRTLDVKFSTYAVPMILGEVRRYLRDNNSISSTLWTPSPLPFLFLSRYIRTAMTLFFSWIRSVTRKAKKKPGSNISPFRTP